jgi:acyl-CoA oxidase
MLRFHSCFQKEDGSEHAEVVTMCCAIKPLAAWHLEQLATIARERCGGQVRTNTLGQCFITF